MVFFYIDAYPNHPFSTFYYDREVVINIFLMFFIANNAFKGCYIELTMGGSDKGQTDCESIIISHTLHLQETNIRLEHVIYIHTSTTPVMLLCYISNCVDVYLFSWFIRLEYFFNIIYQIVPIFIYMSWFIRLESFFNVTTPAML